MEKSKNVRFIENIFIQEPNTMPPEKSYFPAIAIVKLNKEMVNLNSAVLTFDGPLHSVKTDVYHPNDKTYSGNCYSHVTLKKGNFPSISYYFFIPKIFDYFFPHTRKNRNRRKSNLLP